MSYGVKIVWLIGVVVCLHAAPWVQLLASAGNDGRYCTADIISSCPSAATLCMFIVSWNHRYSNLSNFALFTPGHGFPSATNVVVVVVVVVNTKAFSLHNRLSPNFAYR